VSALVLVCAGLSGYRLGAYSDEQAAREERAVEADDWEAVADVTLEVWGRCGLGDGVRELVLANARAELLTELEQPPQRPAVEAVEEVRAPTLVLTGELDAPQMDELGDLLVERIAGSERVRFEHSDHFPNMREPERFNSVVLDFLSG
jgi:3-oxoadipate enol-lactonase